MGRYRYTVLGQGITSASDIFNLLTDGDIRYSGIQAIKNMDDILIYSDTLEGLKKELELFLEMCKKKNLKLKPQNSESARRWSLGAQSSQVRH